MKTIASKPIAFLAGILLGCLLAATLYLNAYTLLGVLHSQTNVLWRDQWWFLGELQSVYEGKNWAQVLWSPFWGHRSVLLRLLFYLDARFFSFRNGPLLCIGWGSLLTHIALLIAVNRAMFGSFFSWRFVTALIVLLNLCLSSLQLENLIWAFQLQYPLIFFCATLSFVLLAFSNGSKHRAVLIGMSCASAVAGSLTMAHGFLIWPVLAIQAHICKRDRKLILGLFIAFFLFAGIYAVHYEMPNTGMGLRGQLKRPLRALEISLMVLGGPISNRSLPWGVAAGAIGAMALIAFALAIKRSARPVWPGVYLSIALFIIATASLTVGGRFSPELLKQLVAAKNELLPSRYLTFAFFFWTSIFILALWRLQAASLSKFIAAPAMLVPIYLVVAYGSQQIAASDSWDDFMHSLDATGTSFLIGAPDWERQKLLWSDQSQLYRWAAFARAHHLTNFSEERYQWLNSALMDRFQIAGSALCEGKVERFEPLSNTTWRVTGWAWDSAARTSPTDIVLVDAENRIAGLARGGIRHHDTGGHSSRVVIWRAGWLGYYHSSDNQELSQAKAFAVLGKPRSACRLQ